MPERPEEQKELNPREKLTAHLNECDECRPGAYCWLGERLCGDSLLFIQIEANKAIAAERRGEYA